MEWQPSTRGTAPSKDYCHYKDCRDNNDNTNHQLVDTHGPRFFCEPHWRVVCFLMNMVNDCAFCKRNKRAEWDRKNANIDSVRYHNKWYDLCVKHTRIYDDLIITILLLDDD